MDWSDFMTISDGLNAKLGKENNNSKAVIARNINLIGNTCSYQFGKLYQFFKNIFVMYDISITIEVNIR